VTGYGYVFFSRLRANRDSSLYMLAVLVACIQLVRSEDFVIPSMQRSTEPTRAQETAAAGKGFFLNKKMEQFLLLLVVYQNNNKVN